MGETNATMTFNEIAIIEPGEPGSSYPSGSFYDFVVVQGSLDGNMWFDIGKGYDATDNTDWENAYYSGSAIDESLYRKRTLDIHDRFSSGDTVLIRFKLYADQAVNGWGWAIDSLNIQNPDVGISDKIANSGFALSQNFPNPFTGITTLSYTLPKAEQVNISVYDIHGRLVEQLVNEQLPQGSHQVDWNGRNVQAGTYYYQIKAGTYTETKKMLLVK